MRFAPCSQGPDRLRRIPVPRILFLLLLLGTSIGMTRSEPVLRAQSEARSRIVATPVALDPRGGRRSVGALRYVAGYALTSADPRFGGISAMSLTPDGFVALSDGGTVMWITAKPGTGRRPSALRLLPLPAGPGDSTVKADRDSEAMTTDARGHIWVAYERHNSLWRYSPGFGRAEGNRAPPEMARWRLNSGAEAMARLPDGRFLLFSEGAGRAPNTSPGTSPNTSEVLIFDRDPVDPRAKGVRAGYRLPAGFSVTDAALLGDGRLMTLHRSFSISHGVAASVGIVDLDAFTAGAIVTPRIVATLRPPFTVDNMEALAVEHVGARTFVWIASDDNFIALQRTLLMRFELVER